MISDSEAHPANCSCLSNCDGIGSDHGQGTCQLIISVVKITVGMCAENHSHHFAE